MSRQSVKREVVGPDGNGTLVSQDARSHIQDLEAMLVTLESQRWANSDGHAEVQRLVTNEIVALREAVRRHCKSCGSAFWLYESAIAWHDSQGQRLPNRCLGCRRERRQYPAP